MPPVRPPTATSTTGSIPPGSGGQLGNGLPLEAVTQSDGGLAALSAGGIQQAVHKVVGLGLDQSVADGVVDGPFYLIKVSPTSIGSMGGLKVNTNSEVLKDGAPIPGLYAAGETANGDFYYRENSPMVSMTSLLFIM